MTNKSKKRSKKNNRKARTEATTEAKAASVPPVAPEPAGTGEQPTPQPEAATEAPKPVAEGAPVEAAPVDQLPLPNVPDVPATPPEAPAPEVAPVEPAPSAEPIKEKVNLTERVKGKKTTKVDRIAAKRNKRLRKFARWVKDGRGRLVLQLTGGKTGEPFLVRFKLPKGHLLRGKEGFVSRSPTYEVRGLLVSGGKGNFGLPMLFVVDG